MAAFSNTMGRLQQLLLLLETFIQSNGGNQFLLHLDCGPFEVDVDDRDGALIIRNASIRNASIRNASDPG